ncbi:type IA DNA topoisomerase [Arsenophonus nasoniae]|uniref:DNA topoisomerase n=1 Tax=Arsenophonus nasoniae TaxID=638 RepID=A0AA95K7N0_9GAMM|nr:DNA topoisomerase 3 [Arsenophonus nasoniae]WGM03515.1 DNA topoisomerase 3 [Arsenophonus nasoniae]
MNLYIAEKPQIASDIVKALGGKFTRKEGYFESDRDVVTWCYGHIIQSAEPENYHPDYKRWRKEDLPLKLYPVKYQPCEGKEKQVKIVVELIKKANVIIHAGDPDDEGQLLVDEVLIYANNTKPVKRLLINDNTDAAVKKALNNLKDNQKFKGLFYKALARSVGDDIYGKSMTRAYTVTAQQKGYRGTPLSVGRVQTPILGLICRRYLANKNHKESFYYTITGIFDHLKAEFEANWQIRENAPQDDKKRLIDKDFAERVAKFCEGKTADVVAAAVDNKETAPPLPFNLVKLQQYMNKNHKMTAAKTLEITQQLREKYKAITYNRSDCSYLSEEQYSESPQLITALKNLNLFSEVKTEDTLKSKAFDSAKVTAHTAIIPTINTPDLSQLSDDEKTVYLAIARYYLTQFLPNKRYQEASVLLKIDTETFTARATKTTDNGFTEFLKDKENEEVEQDKGQFAILAKIRTGEKVDCLKATVNTKKTTPPPLFTEASLLAALVRVADFVTDAKIKTLLKTKDKDKKDEHGGIGTPATRHSMIEKLKAREFIVLDKRNLIPTQKGLDFFQALPDIATNPDMTALWAEKQEQIEQGNLSVDEFVEQLYGDINRLLADDIGQNLKIDTPTTHQTSNAMCCPNCNKALLDKPKLVVCEAQCGFKIWKTVCEKTLTPKQVETLVKKGKTGIIKGFKSKAGKNFDAALILQDKTTGATRFEFENNR